MLEIKNVSFSAQGRKILDDINLVIPDGKLICLTGPNGGGKTTLAKMIAGVEKPDEGQILLDGVDIVPLDPTERARAGVGYAFQQPVRFKGITVRDILNMAAGRTLSDEELANVLREVGLEAGEYVDRGVGNHLSGGEIKRIEIATVLLRHSRLAVFDEPEAGIDLWSFDNLSKVFKKLKSENVTLIIISHQERILKLADEIIVLDGGKIKQKGTPNKLLPQLIRRGSCN